MPFAGWHDSLLQTWSLPDVALTCWPMHTVESCSPGLPPCISGSRPCLFRDHPFDIALARWPNALVLSGATPRYGIGMMGNYPCLNPFRSSRPRPLATAFGLRTLPPASNLSLPDECRGILADYHGHIVFACPTSLPLGLTDAPSVEAPSVNMLLARWPIEIVSSDAAHCSSPWDTEQLPVRRSDSFVLATFPRYSLCLADTTPCLRHARCPSIALACGSMIIVSSYSPAPPPCLSGRRPCLVAGQPI